jgi:hypothetical protein
MITKRNHKKTSPLSPRRPSKNSSPSTRCEETHEVLKLPKGIYSSPLPRYLNPFTSHNGIPLVCLLRTLYLDATILPLERDGLKFLHMTKLLHTQNCNCFILPLDAAKRLTKCLSLRKIEGCSHCLLEAIVIERDNLDE